MCDCTCTSRDQRQYKQVWWPVSPQTHVIPEVAEQPVSLGGRRVLAEPERELDAALHAAALSAAHEAAHRLSRDDAREHRLPQRTLVASSGTTAPAHHVIRRQRNMQKLKVTEPCLSVGTGASPERAAATSCCWSGSVFR